MRFILFEQLGDTYPNCQPWQAFEKTLVHPSVADFARAPILARPVQAGLRHIRNVSASTVACVWVRKDLQRVSVD